MCSEIGMNNHRFIPRIFLSCKGPVDSVTRTLAMGFYGPSSIPGRVGVQIFIHTIVLRVAFRATQPPIKLVLLEVKSARA